LALQCFGANSRWEADALLANWRDALQALSNNECATLRAFSHQSEREFLVGLHAFLQDWMAAKLDPAHDAAEPTAPTGQSLSALLEGLPVLHQEIAFLTLTGYSQATLEKILRIAPAVAEEGLGRLRANYALLLERNEDTCLWPSAWLGIRQAARANFQKDCTPLRQLIRILDGQASWYDKTPAETHRSKCLHCLEVWSSLLEIVAWDRARKPYAAEKIEPLLAAVPVKLEKRKASLFARMLGK
jgi:hypothetical protein